MRHRGGDEARSCAASGTSILNRSSRAHALRQSTRNATVSLPTAAHPGTSAECVRLGDRGEMGKASLLRRPADYAVIRRTAQHRSTERGGALPPLAAMRTEVLHVTMTHPPVHVRRPNSSAIPVSSYDQ